MLIRLRSRDGLERIQLSDHATVGDLKKQINANLGIPVEDIRLSRDKDLLTSVDKAGFEDLSRPGAPLEKLGIQHGDMVYMHYPFEREVASTVPRTAYEDRKFGTHMTVDELVAKQTRIERQETPHAASVSFERHAADAFQSYVRDALAFSIKRGGLLYGSVDDEGKVSVEAIFEPQQDGSGETLQLERGSEEEQRADFVAKQLGLQKVGWIFSQSTMERDFIMSAEEVCQMAAIQAELGDRAVTGVVSTSVTEEGSPETHFEAFQVTDQAVRLWQEGWFTNSTNFSGVSAMCNPKEPQHKAPVIVAGKDVGEVDNDYLLIPVNILDHEGPLSATFPIENRLLPQGKAELRHHLQKNKARPYAERLSDFHLLLFLAKQPNLDMADLAIIIEAVKTRAAVPEGYTLIIDSLAEL
ncbi:g3344 [Coccomyxa elongata]